MATTPVFLPGKFHGQRSLAVYSPWGCTEFHLTEHTHTYTHTHTHTHTEDSHWKKSFSEFSCKVDMMMQVAVKIQ